jgi:DNA-binding response OmpR family regulator
MEIRAAIPPRPVAPHPALLEGLRILLVDDDPDERCLLTNYLLRLKYRVYVADNGQDGYNKAQILLPDLILMDVAMPVCDGLTACRLLQASSATRHIPVLFLTAAGLPDERVRGLATGAVDYVVKPFDLEEVRMRIAIHLGASRLANGGPEPKEFRTVGLAGGLNERLFRTTRELLISRLHETPNLADLAHAANTNPYRLNQAFRHCVGTTVFDFLFEERMKHALRLLSDTSLDIRTIAAAVGYDAARNFSTAFRKRFGCSPSELRRRERSGM